MRLYPGTLTDGFPKVAAGFTAFAGPEFSHHLSPGRTRGLGPLHAREMRPEAGCHFWCERGRRFEFFSGHIIAQGTAQLLQSGTAAIIVQIDDGHQQAARSHVAFENHAEPPVAVPIVNRCHDGEERTRG